MRKRSWIIALVVALLCTAAGCSAPPAHPEAAAGAPSAVRGEIVVFAAASLTDAFQDIGRAFEAAHPGTRVTFSFGGSSALRMQLEQGARADVFASANEAEMAKAESGGLLTGKPLIFARNRLVVIVPKDNPAHLKTLHDLAKPGVRLVTAADGVPIAAYTQDLLRRLSRDPQYGSDFVQRVNANVVSREQDVRQIVLKVSLGEADAAVAYATDVTPDVAGKVRTVEVPGAFNVLAAYPLAVLKTAPNPAGAEAFARFVLGPDGQSALKKWGFLPAPESSP
ncbi:MAG: molybdate ABC transporter substrate-binding protein [Firmicutes bacterium]|nr:molybdate ABC transporter substrate-binding protein [Bacillota bacterium]